MEDLSFILNHLGEDRTKYFDAVTPPIVTSSNFTHNTVEAMRKAALDEQHHYWYTRGNNPTTDLLNKKLAALQGSEDALCVGSGSAAVSMAVLHCAKAGNHIVSVNNPYSWTNKLFTLFLNEYGIETTFVDGTRVEAFQEAIRPNTSLIYLESPNSLTFDLQDIETICKIAKSHGIKTVIDNSYSSPLGQNPIELGCDLVVHSATKYLSGHSDLVAGAIMGSKEDIAAIFKGPFMTLGGILSPFNAWQLLRSLRTLEIRLERVSQTTQKVVAFLENHPMISEIWYPHSPSHPQYELALKQMKMPLGLFSLKLNTTNPTAITAFCESLKYFLMAVSWGGYESLIWPAIAAYSGARTDLPINLVRMSIGLENADTLINDLNQALEIAHKIDTNS